MFIVVIFAFIAWMVAIGAVVLAAHVLAGLMLLASAVLVYVSIGMLIARRVRFSSPKI